MERGRGGGGRLVQCGENRAGPSSDRQAVNIQYRTNTLGLSSSNKNTAARPGFPHSLAASRPQRVDSQHTLASTHHRRDLPINVSFPSQERFSKLTHLTVGIFPPQTQTR